MTLTTDSASGVDCLRGPEPRSRVHSASELPVPRLGFLGVGWIGRHRLQSLAKSGLVKIAAIADTNPELLQQAALVAPGAAVFRSIQDLLEVGVEGMVIATPSALHAQQAMQALERGMAVFCQKPLGRNAAETRQVIEAAQRADRLLGVDLSYRYVTAVRKVRDLVQSGAVGGVFAVDLVFHNAYGPDKPWFYSRNLSGGGCVIDLGIHMVDLALWCLGFPDVVTVTSRLYAGGKLMSPNRAPSENDTVEDYAVARLDLGSGASIQLACSWKLSAGCDADISAAFYGTKAMAAFRNKNGSFFDFTAEHCIGTKRVVIWDKPEDWGGLAAVAWAERLRQSIAFDPAVEHLCTVANVLDKIYESRG